MSLITSELSQAALSQAALSQAALPQAAEAVPQARQMPDVAVEARAGVDGRLEWVGMGEIDAPIVVAGPAQTRGMAIATAAKVDAFVNLADPHARGIHMSRLYLHVDKALAAEPLSPDGLHRLLREFLASHAGLSDRALLQLRFEHLLRRRALVSDNSGWKAYPVRISALLDGDRFGVELGVDVMYSSTCPCSAALARQLIQDRFDRDFATAGEALDPSAVRAWLGTEQGICATPHSQRSRAQVQVRLAPEGGHFPIVALIDRIEDALTTPVQTAVKRADEQAFARLNAENLMFCEDAARRVQAALNTDPQVLDFHVRVAHLESLHAHDAVAVANKGLAGGYAALR